jgi:hypothetical protein
MGLVAVLLYLLILRPMAVAKQFIHTMEASTDLGHLTREYFGENIRMDTVSVKGTLQKRTWTDMFSCRQRFNIKLMKPKPNTDGKTVLALRRDFDASPFGVHEMRGPTLMEYR